MKLSRRFKHSPRILLAVCLCALMVLSAGAVNAQSYSRLIFTHGVGYANLTTDNDAEYDEIIVEKDQGIHPFNNNYRAIPICAVNTYHTNGDNDISWACEVEETEYNYIIRLQEWGDGSDDGYISANAVLLDSRFFRASSGAYFWLYSDRAEYQYFGSEIVWRDYDDTQNISFKNLPENVIPIVTINYYDANGDDDFSFNTLFNWNEEQFEMNAENGNDGSVVFGAVAFVYGRRGSNYAGQIDENGYIMRGNHPSGVEYEFNPRWSYWDDSNNFAFNTLFYYVPFDKDLSAYAYTLLPDYDWDEGIRTIFTSYLGNTQSLVGFQTIFLQTQPYMEWTTY